MTDLHDSCGRCPSRSACIIAGQCIRDMETPPHKLRADGPDRRGPGIQPGTGGSTPPLRSTPGDAGRLNAEHPLNAQTMVREFHATFEQPIRDIATIPPRDERVLRADLLEEELDEYKAASWNLDVVEVADALADIVYVAYGAALHWGIDLDRVLAEVHRSNMTKVFPDGTVRKQPNGKVIKPPTYEKPDIKSCLDFIQRTEACPIPTQPPKESGDVQP